MDPVLGIVAALGAAGAFVLAAARRHRAVMQPEQHDLDGIRVTVQGDRAWTMLRAAPGQRLMSAWLDDEAKATLKVTPRAKVGLEGRKLTVECEVPPPTTAARRHLAWRAATVARGGARLLDRWRQAARALEARFDLEASDWPVEDAMVRIELPVPQRKAAIVATADGALVEISLIRRSSEPLDIVDMAQLPRAHWKGWNAAGPERVSRQSTVSILIADLTPDVRRWRAAIDLALALCDDLDRPPELSAFR